MAKIVSNRSPERIRKEVAHLVIGELSSSRSDVLDYLKAESPRADHVYEEEGVDIELRDRGLTSRLDYHLTIGVVFQWLKEKHNVETPVWWTLEEERLQAGLDLEDLSWM